MFDELLGNERLKERIVSVMSSGKHSHCYLISGPAGAGKKTLASLLARGLQCESTPAPCGRCNICRKVRMNIHPDVITVDDPDRKTVSVEQIRQIQADAYIRPNEGKYKIYLIPRGETMTDGAQNALLKLIEEPPSYVVFLILTTNADKLLSTVRSRSAELRLEPVPWLQAQAWLHEQAPQADTQSLQAAHLRGGGFLGQALELLQRQKELPQTGAFLRAFAAGDRFALMQVLASMEKMPRDQILCCLTDWKQLLAEAIAARAGLPAGTQAQVLGRSCTARKLAAAAQAVQEAIEQLSANIGTGHICGALAIKLT